MSKKANAHIVSLGEGDTHSSGVRPSRPISSCFTYQLRATLRVHDVYQSSVFLCIKGNIHCPRVAA